MPDASFDAIITDPPYGTTACKWDSVIPFEPMWEQLKRLIKPRGAIVLFGSQPFTSALIMSNAKAYRYGWNWNKRITGNPFLANYQPLKIHEDISIFSFETHNYYPQMSIGSMRKKGGGYSKLHDVKHSTSCNNTFHPTSILDFSAAVRGVHPTQKPVALMEYLVKTYTNEGEKILDFTMGSGSTGVAAIRTKREFVGIERDETYFNVAKERLEAATGTFAPRESHEYGGLFAEAV